MVVFVARVRILVSIMGVIIFVCLYSATVGLSFEPYRCNNDNEAQAYLIQIQI